MLISFKPIISCGAQVATYKMKEIPGNKIQVLEQALGSHSNCLLVFPPHSRGWKDVDEGYPTPYICVLGLEGGREAGAVFLLC